MNLVKAVDLRLFDHGVSIEKSEQEQPPEVFYKKRCSQKFHKILTPLGDCFGRNSFQK